MSGPPAGRVPDLGGPKVQTMAEVARGYRQAQGWRRPVLNVPIAGKAARAFKAGVNLCPDHADGTVTWEQWLASRYGS